jgi:hypothetical protein
MTPPESFEMCHQMAKQLAVAVDATAEKVNAVLPGVAKAETGLVAITVSAGPIWPVDDRQDCQWQWDYMPIVSESHWSFSQKKGRKR